MTSTATESRQLLSMTWRDAFFASWPVDPAVVEPTLPDGLAIDTDDEGALYQGVVDHEPWEVQPAELTIEESTLFEASGFDRPEGEPLVQYSPGVPVTAGRLRRVEHRV